MNKIIKIILHLLLTVVVVFLYTCQKDLSSPNANQAPTTTIYNKPAQGDTVFALATLAWDGGDDDGYIKGFQYRYTTYYSWDLQNSVFEDSVAQDWEFIDSTQKTLAFNSARDLNLQKFQVRAVDNNDEVDPTPAEKIFFTTQTIPPQVEILVPANKSESFALNQTTDWWQGIELSFEGSDDDGEILEYGYSIDGQEWKWITDTTLFIKPDEFKQPLNGEHIIYVNAKDNTFIKNQNPDSVKINLVVPSFDKDILVIDETDEESFPKSVSTTDAAVDSFYADLFGTDPDSSWDYLWYAERAVDNLPSYEYLGQFKTIIWHADNRPTSGPHALANHIDYIKNYMNVGGNFVMSGWRILKSFAWDSEFPVTFGDSSFVKQYLHIEQADETPYWPGDFSGADGMKGFSDVEVDSAKLATFPFEGKLSVVNVVLRRSGFTDILYKYRNEQSSDLLEFRGKTCGLLYTGTSFNAIILGFPMYFIKEEDTRVMAEEILRVINY